MNLKKKIKKEQLQETWSLEKVRKVSSNDAGDEQLKSNGGHGGNDRQGTTHT